MTTNKQQQSHQVNKTVNAHTNELDLDAMLQTDNGRKLFGLYLKELNNSVDTLLTLYLICCCFQNQRIDDRTRIKQILEKTYQTCFVKNQLPYLSAELKQRLCDTLKRATYNESIFNAVKKEIKHILETNYYPAFLKSKIYVDNLKSQKSHNATIGGGETHSGAFENSHKTSNIKPVKSMNRSMQANRLVANDSTLSLKVPPSNESFQIPSNPYSVLTKPIPVSCQDSEIQSVLSEDDYHHYHSSSRHSRTAAKLDKNIKQSLAANRNVKLNLPEVGCNSFNYSTHDQWNDTLTQNNTTAHQPAAQSNKKIPIPLSESDPRKFFELLTAKLDKFLQQEPHRARARQSMSTTNLTDDMSNLNIIDNHIDEHINHISKHHGDIKPNHHFYQLTSKSKEVDIDSQKPFVDSGHLSAATKSIDSIERVNDWLTSNTKTTTDEVKKPTVAPIVNEKITVAYYLPGEELAYISTYNGKYLTLAQFKQLITKKGNFRYFFKTKSDLLDEECVVYQEATDESSFVPMFNGKVIAKIEKI